ncbi:Tautomerase enzyme [Kosakonia oryziphila]|uniref:Tautomerase enzyme n=1 Tax=Kosakonia oryziphila TaxID=1005667 RepID=A0A1C4GBB2_9ENTR|nr:Tautomerase enzyme [Kosakonia oryziphila]
MPHVDIKCFPRDLNDEQKAALAEDIADVIIRHLYRSVQRLLFPERLLKHQTCGFSPRCHALCVRRLRP